MAPSFDETGIDRILDCITDQEKTPTNSAIETHVHDVREEIRRRAYNVFQMGLPVGVPLFEAVVDNIDVSKLAIQIGSTEDVTYGIMTGIMTRVRAFSDMNTLDGMEGSEHSSRTSLDMKRLLNNKKSLQRNPASDPTHDSNKRSQPETTSSNPSQATAIQWPGPAPAHAFILKHWFDIAVAKCKNEGQDAVIVGLNDLEGLSDGVTKLYAKLLITYERLLEHLPENERAEFESEGWYQDALSMGRLQTDIAEEPKGSNGDMLSPEQTSSLPPKARIRSCAALLTVANIGVPRHHLQQSSNSQPSHIILFSESGRG